MTERTPLLGIPYGDGPNLYEAALREPSKCEHGIVRTILCPQCLADMCEGLADKALANPLELRPLERYDFWRRLAEKYRGWASGTDESTY